MEPNNDQPRTQFQPPPKPEKPAKAGSKKVLMMLLVIVLIAGAAYGGYWWGDKEASKQSNQQSAKISELEQKVTKLEKDLAEAKGMHEETSTAPSAEMLENIKAAITSGNTAALEGHLASTVHVILAASEGLGDRTPTQVISDLAYIDAATDWDFDLPAATIDAYQAGDYKQYFPDTALVGKSANNYVISFTFNDAGKISGIFLTNSADLLS